MPQAGFQSNDTELSSSFVSFAVDKWHLALPLEAVRRVLPIVEFLPLPGAPSAVSGVLRLDGRPIPVVDLRVLFGAAPAAAQAEDVLVLAKTPARDVALWADRVEGVLAIGRGELRESEPLVGENRFIREVASRGDGLILIYNLEELLAPEEESALAQALEQLEKKARS